MENIYNYSKKMMWIFGVTILINISCVSLDEEPKDFPSPDNFYSTVGQVEAGLTGSVATLFYQWGGYSWGWGQYSNAFLDDHVHGNEMVFNVNYGNQIWTIHYQAITLLNGVIKALNNDQLGATVSQEEKDQLMGQAKFLRGFNYFSLVRLYGKIPLITEETNVVKDEITRKPITEVYDFIINDLQTGVQYLPDTWPADKIGRPAKGAAKGLLAKVYLTMATAPLKDAANFINARDMAFDVMDDGYSLVEDVSEVFLTENKYSSEMMFSFNATEDDPSTAPQTWMPGSMAFGWSDISIDLEWSEKYPDQARKDSYMILEDYDGVSYKEWTGWAKRPHVRKYLPEREFADRILNNTNIPILRFADVLLIFAEAENMINGGPTQPAVDAINHVIDRANGWVDNPNHAKLTTSMTQEEFDMAVIEERSLEFFAEYDRWYDLIRKEIVCESMREEIQVNCNENDYLWPIPLKDLRLNPLLEQNPGYDTPQDLDE